ncbi:MAG: 2-isopropylmalate synthase [Hyphomicrobiales bacterium]|nr:MAG: 2-isopropylmalate synthase [Hyphomicrobiales bacterium]
MIKARASTAKTKTTNASGDHDQVLIFDTTLRDGEQSPGASMTHDEKLMVAHQLDQMGVDIIEAGFPIASNGDFEAVSEIAKTVEHAVVAGLARAIPADIDRAAEAVRHAKRGRIHTFVSTSPIHLVNQMKKTQEEVLEIITKSVTQARNLVEDVEWSGMDATRTPIDYLCQTVEAAINAGATTINIPDTVGYMVADEYYDMIAELINRVPNSDKAIFSTHCHDDLGCAVSNSLAGARAGARQIECTINGLGERAGNAALEEIVMAIRTRPDVLPFRTGIETTELMRASKMVANVSGFVVQYNKAIVGANAFAHESGIHQDGMLKNAETYEIMRPQDVGVKETSLVMGKHSGRHAFKEKLIDLGFDLGDNSFQDAFRRFKDLADKKKHVYDEDIEALVSDEATMAGESIRVEALTVIAGTSGPQKATMTLSVDGEHVTKEATGDGPVDATFNAIRMIVPHEAKLQLYQVSAVTEGTDAQAEVSVRLEENDMIATGKGAETDTMVASAKAYVSALNKLIARRGRVHAQKLEAI